jgi:hypothetical protein
MVSKVKEGVAEHKNLFSAKVNMKVRNPDG